MEQASRKNATKVEKCWKKLRKKNREKTKRKKNSRYSYVRTYLSKPELSLILPNEMINSFANKNDFLKHFSEA